MRNHNPGKVLLPTLSTCVSTSNLLSLFYYPPYVTTSSKTSRERKKRSQAIPWPTCLLLTFYLPLLRKELSAHVTMKRSRSAPNFHKLDNDLIKKTKVNELFSIVGSLQDQMTSLVEMIKKQNVERTPTVTKGSNSKEEGINSENKIPNEENTTKEALASHLLSKEYPANWKRPKSPQYKGSTDPIDHVQSS